MLPKVARAYARFGPQPENTTTPRDFQGSFPVLGKQYAWTGPGRFYGTRTNDPFGRAYIYPQDKITVQDYDLMRFDGQIRAGMQLIKLPIRGCGWQIMCQDSDISNLITEILKPIWAKLIKDICLGLDFGWVVGEQLKSVGYNLTVSQTSAALNSAQEKTYPYYIRLDDVMMVDNVTSRLLAFERSGHFAGFEQFTPELVVVANTKAFHWANDMELQELYGISRMRACYPYWLFKKQNYDWLNVGFETMALPYKKIMYPDGSTEWGQDENGEPVSIPNQQIAMELGENLGNNNTIIIPSGVYEETKTPMWDVSFVKSEFDGAPIIEYIDKLNLEILKGLLIPELALNTGSSGSYDLAQEQIRMFMKGLQATLAEIASVVTLQIVQPLVRDNFGRFAPKAYLQFEPLADDVVEGLTNVLLETIGAGQPIPLVDGNQMVPDYQKMAEMTNLPFQFLKEDALAEYRKAQQANQAASPDMPFEGGPPGQQQQNGPGDASFGGGKRQNGFGSKGGASNQPDNYDQGGGDNGSNDGEMGLSEAYQGWEVKGNRLKWAS